MLINRTTGRPTKQCDVAVRPIINAMKALCIISNFDVQLCRREFNYKKAHGRNMHTDKFVYRFSKKNYLLELKPNKKLIRRGDTERELVYDDIVYT